MSEPSGPMDDLARPLKCLHAGFWGSVLAFALAMGASSFSVTSGAALTVVSGTAFCVFAFLYWGALGILAHRTGRSWILWIVAGLATLALGFIVSYILMTSRVRRELRAKAAIDAAARDTPNRNSHGSA